MKNIYKGVDDLYYVINIQSCDSSVPISPSDLDAFRIELYTSGDEKVEFDKDDITDEGILYIDASTLNSLPDGALRARFFIGLPDSGFSDEEYNQSAERLTGFFLKSLKEGQI